jgi:hypothetical protein
MKEGTAGGIRADLNGMYFRSSWEANYARYLNWLKKNSAIHDWDYEPDEFEFKEIKRGTRFYKPDFKIWNSPEDFEYHEIKGYMDSVSQTKLKRMAKYYPHIKVVVIGKLDYKAIERDIKPFIPFWE